MDFEVKKVSTIGGVKTKDSNTSTQMLCISVGVVNCPYDDIKVDSMVNYDFNNSLTVTEVMDGINVFAQSWVESNYPNTPTGV